MSSEPRNESQIEKEREFAMSNLISLVVESRGNKGMRRRREMREAEITRVQ